MGSRRSLMANLSLQSMAIDLRRLAEGKIKNYQSEFFTNLVKNRYSLAPKLVVSEFTDSEGSHRRAEREREARPKAPKSSEKQITESLFDGEEEYNATKSKMSALYRVKGRVLLSLCKTQAPDSRTAFVRWYVRTHRKFGKYCIQQFAVKSKVSSQVALWRFKFLAQPFRARRKNVLSFAGELVNIMDIIEKRSSEGRIKDAFAKILRSAVQLKQTSENRHGNQFCDFIDSAYAMCYAQLTNDTN